MALILAKSRNAFLLLLPYIDSCLLVPQPSKIIPRQKCGYLGTAESHLEHNALLLKL